MSDDAERAAVLVVGAGPTGLTMAAELTRHGVPCRIIDKAAARSDKSKALGIHARTMEIFEDMGLIEQALAAGWNMYGGNIFYDGERIVHISLDEADSPYPFVLTLPQSETERVLEEHLSGLGVKVEREVELTAFEDAGDHVSATLTHAGGREEHIRTPFLIGCDGSHSTVRHGLGLAFEGSAYEEMFALADVRIGWANPEDEMYIFLAEEGVVACFPYGNQRWRVILDVSEDQVKGSEPELSDLQEIVEERGAVSASLSDPRWLSWFKIHRRSVKEYRRGRVFLAGDSAHIHSPMGGQGMNTGIQDAYNLAWKLALAVRGHADEILLDSYQAERHPVGQLLLKGTDMATKVVTIRNPVAQAARNRLISLLTSIDVVQQRLVRTGTMLAVNYRHSPIVGEHRGSLATVRVFGGADSEKPDVSAWFQFGRGPAPGDRAPDATIIDPANGGPVRLFQAVRGIAHNLLLLDGNPTAEGYANLQQVARAVTDKYGDLVTVHAIVAGSQRPPAFDLDGKVWLDPDMALHSIYGAGSESLFLLRPDGYVGFRSQPADKDSLLEYLGRILR